MKHARIFFYLVGLHSIGVGIALILSPSDFLSNFGYDPISEPFFKVQGGVFHLVMAAAYFGAAKDPIANTILIRFTIFAKFLATLFLISYFIFYHQVIVILFSGLGDLAMGLIALFFLRNIKKEFYEQRS